MYIQMYIIDIIDVCNFKFLFEMFHNSGINIFNIVDHGQSLAIDIKLLQRLVIFTINKYDLFFIFFLTLPSVDPVVFYILKMLLRKHYLCFLFSYS